MSPRLLNTQAAHLCQQAIRQSKELGIELAWQDARHTVIDFGVRAVGSIEAGRLLSRICLAGMATVKSIEVSTHRAQVSAIGIEATKPWIPCIGSQYAGWPISLPGYFGMCSGPIRMVRGREPILKAYDLRETSPTVVAVLESNEIPDESVCRAISDDLDQDEAPRLVICVARTSSLAGTIQIVARSVETACHKLHELGFDLRRILHGAGSAPVPKSVAGLPRADSLAMGDCNDAILYGGSVRLVVQESDDWIEENGDRVPSNSSKQYGRPFLEILEACGGDFYQMDPLLFAPARIEFESQTTGRSWEFGELAWDRLDRFH